MYEDETAVKPRQGLSSQSRGPDPDNRGSRESPRRTIKPLLRSQFHLQRRAADGAQARRERSPFQDALWRAATPLFETRLVLALGAQSATSSDRMRSVLAAVTVQRDHGLFAVPLAI